MATAFSVFLDQLIEEPGLNGIGWKFTTVAVNAGTVTTNDPEINKLATNTPAERFQGAFLYMPSLVSASQVRSITTISVTAGVTTITHAGPDTATDTAITAYILAVHPTVLMNLANDALSKDLFMECFIPLYHGPASADMQGSAVDTDWTETNATDATQATASEVWAGAQSFLVTDSGSGGGYIESADLPIGQGREIMLHTVAKTSGTAKLHALDGSDNTQGVITTTQGQWVYGGKKVSYDSAGELVSLRAEADGASDTIDLQFLWFVRLGESMFNLPAWVAERFNVTRIDKAVFHQRGSEDDTWLANSVEYTRLENDRDYRFVARYADANPTQVWVDAKHLESPLFVVVACPFGAPYGVSTLFTTYSSTTVCPERLLIPAWKRRIGGLFGTYFPEAEARGTQELALATAVRTNPAPPPRQWGGLRRIS